MSLKKTLDVEIRERVEASCRAIMEDHPEVEAIGTMFLSKHLSNVLAGMIVGADGPRLRPDQNVRMFEVWVRVGALLLANNHQDVHDLDQLLGKYARSIADAQKEAQGLQPQRTTRTAEEA